MIDFSFAGVDPFKDKIKFKYNNEIKNVIVDAESKGQTILKHNFSKICSEVMFKCEATYEGKDRKVSRFNLDTLLLAVLTSNVNAYPIENPNGNGYHTWIVSVVNLMKLSIREIDFLKTAFGGKIDYEVGVISIEVLFSEYPPDAPIVRSYTDAAPVIMINHIKDTLIGMRESAEISAGVQRDIDEYMAAKNIDQETVQENSVGDGIERAEQIASGKPDSLPTRLLKNHKAVTIAMTSLLILLAMRVSAHLDYRPNPRILIFVAMVGVGYYAFKKGIFKSRIDAIKNSWNSRKRSKEA